MDNPIGMRIIECLADAAKDMQRDVKRKALFGLQLGPQRTTRHILHHRVVEGRMVTMVIDLDNIGVSKAASDIGLALNPLDILGVLRHKQLDRHQAILEGDMARKDNLAGATFAYRLLNSIIADALWDTRHGLLV